MLVVLKTGLTPSASGSAYLEVGSQILEPHSVPDSVQSKSSTKISCTVHGPRPLPRSAPFSPSLLLSTHVKFAPFATRTRRGYLRDPSEKDLAIHLETALRGVIIGDRWPKSGVDVVITILEAEEPPEHEIPSGTVDAEASGHPAITLLNVLSHCITVASAAIIDAGIDCVDLVVGGTAILTKDGFLAHHANVQPSRVLATATVGYLPCRQEISELWLIGNDQDDSTSTALGNIQNADRVIDSAIQTAGWSHAAVKEAIRERLLHDARKGKSQLGK
ncbi:MAG: 3'-5'-exoribonuclease [Vezdaea aestivalis]|nr:MAG: 3'-5'-exoribonuclease [Vezdaea aestivalis]